MKAVAKIAVLSSGLLAALALATCTVSTTGAPCVDRTNCPNGQFCAIDGICHTTQNDAPCEVDAHCPEGQYCASGMCTAGEAPLGDAGNDTGETNDAGADAGVDAGVRECAIDANCKNAHVTDAKCVDDRCQLTCEQGWENANGDALDGCEAETPCNPAGGFSGGTECVLTSECACGAQGAHCVKGLVDYMGFASDQGVCLGDCNTKACPDSTYKCVPTRLDDKGRPVLQSCFKTGRLTGNFTVLVKDVCKDATGDLRAGSLKIALNPYYADFNNFTGCKDASGAQKAVVVQGFKICAAPNVPCPDIVYLYVREDAIGKAEIPYINENGEPNFGSLYLWAEFDGTTIDKMAVRGMASGGRIFNLAKTATGPLGSEYKGETDVELIEYVLPVCGGTTGKACPQVGQ